MKSPSLMRHGKTIAVIAGMLTLVAPAANAASGPFARMAGIWLGDGRVTLADGEVERIRCRASDDVGDSGDVMRQHLRCASASYNFDVQNMVSYRGGRVTGNWDETTRNIGGQVFGMASPNLVRARVEGGQFAADVTLAPKGNTLDVTLVPHGSDVREVAVALRRT